MLHVTSSRVSLSEIEWLARDIIYKMFFFFLWYENVLNNMFQFHLLQRQLIKMGLCFTGF